VTDRLTIWQAISFLTPARVGLTVAVVAIYVALLFSGTTSSFGYRFLNTISSFGQKAKSENSPVIIVNLSVDSLPDSEESISSSFLSFAIKRLNELGARSVVVSQPEQYSINETLESSNTLSSPSLPVYLPQNEHGDTSHVSALRSALISEGHRKTQITRVPKHQAIQEGASLIPLAQFITKTRPFDSLIYDLHVAHFKTFPIASGGEKFIELSRFNAPVITISDSNDWNQLHNITGKTVFLEMVNTREQRAPGDHLFAFATACVLQNHVIKRYFTPEALLGCIALAFLTISLLSLASRRDMVFGFLGSCSLVGFISYLLLTTQVAYFDAFPLWIAYALVPLSAILFPSLMQVTEEKSEMRYLLANSSSEKPLFRPTFRRLIVFGSIITVVHHACYIGMIPGITGAALTLEPKVVDFWFNLRGQLPPPKDVFIVALDEKTFTFLEQSPLQALPRKVLGQVLSRLHDLGVRKTLLDFIFRHPHDKEDTDPLLKAMKKMPTAVGIDFLVKTRRNENGDIVQISELLSPDPSVAEMATDIALVSLPIDPGGTSRRFAVGRSKILGAYPTLAEAAVESPTSRPSELDMINFYGPSGSIRTLSIADILADDYMRLASKLNGSAVFIGLVLPIGTAGQRKDSFYTPFSRSPTFGVEIHATRALNLIYKNWIKRYLHVEIVGLNLAAFTLGSLIFALQPIAAAILLITAILIWSGISYFAFLNGLFIPGLLLGMLLIGTYSVSTLHYYFVIRRKQKKIKEAFSRYLAPEMVKSISEEKTKAELGAKIITGTALFTDIAGSVSIVEAMKPADVAEMLNDYFTLLMDLVLNNKGTLVKFTGDGLFAIWGAPVPDDEHAKNALQCAREIGTAIDEWNAQSSHPSLPTRTGAHSGPMLVGNFGSRSSRMDYTAIGDTVNTASRIESLNKHFGTELLVSNEILQLAGTHAGSISLGKIQLLGKQDALELFTFLEEYSEEHARKFTEAVRLYQQSEFNKAHSLFQKLSQFEWTLQKASRLYAHESLTLQETLPSSQWNGALALTEK
jgi:adenylate cyclase